MRGKNKMENDKLEKGYDLIYINKDGEVCMKKGSITPQSEIDRLNKLWPVESDKSDTV